MVQIRDRLKMMDHLRHSRMKKQRYASIAPCVAHKNEISNSIAFQCNTPDEEVEDKVEIFKERLRKELVSRDGHGYLNSFIKRDIDFSIFRTLRSQ